MELPGNVIRNLQEDAGVDPDHPCFRVNEIKVVASAQASMEAAAALARHRGVPAVVLSDAIEGEAREIAKVHARFAAKENADETLSSFFRSRSRLPHMQTSRRLRRTRMESTAPKTMPGLLWPGSR
ncbi:hypothetical protein AGR7B_Lc60032 [Agrobacterium deltaense RV3]|nr:hypothetical protein AGR7B_Lc60032 [Agrobacterium deltaense RV3]